MCSHGLADTSDGNLRVAFSDQMVLLETLLEENMKFQNFVCLLIRYDLYSMNFLCKIYGCLSKISH